MDTLSFNAKHLARVRALSHTKSSLKRSAAILIPKSTSRPRVSPDSPDASRPKRVKFAGSPGIHDLEVNQNGPLLQNEVDGAKTSEFKSFKSLLEKAVHKHYFDNVATSDIYMKRSISMDRKEAPSNSIRKKSVEGRSSLPLQDISLAAQSILYSPAQFQQKRPEKTWTRSRPLPNVTPVAQLFHPLPQIVGENDGKHSGPRRDDKGTFSGKRAFLLQLAAGTCSQNVGDFLPNRSDFILEILQRLGIRRNSNEYDHLQKPEQEKRCSSKPRLEDRLLTWDNTEALSCPYNHFLETNLQCKLWKPDMFNGEDAIPLPGFNDPATAIEWSNGLDCNKHSYQIKAHALLNSPCDFAEAKIDRRCQNHDPLHADCVPPNAYNTAHKESLALYTDEFPMGFCIESPTRNFNFSKEGFTLPLLEWDADAEEERPGQDCLVLKDVDHLPTSRHDILGFHDEIGSSSTDVYRRRSSLQSSSFDIMLHDLSRWNELDVSIYPSSVPLPGSVLCIQNSPDSDHSPMYSDFLF